MQLISLFSYIPKLQKAFVFSSIGFVLLIALLLRMPFLSESFWLDEAAQALEVTRPWHQQLMIARDFQPPLLHILLHAAQYLGTSEWWLRTIGALIPGLISIGFAMLVIKRAHSFLISFWIGLLLATSSLHIFFSQELRPYALPAAIASISWWLLQKIIDEYTQTSKVPVKQAISFGIVTTLGLYSSYMYPFLILGQLFYLAVLMNWHQRTQNIVSKKTATILLNVCTHLGKVIFIPAIIVFIAGIPWLPFFWEQLQVGSQLRADLPGWEYVVSTPQWKAIALIPGKFIFGVMSLQPVSVLTLIAMSCLVVLFAFFSSIFAFPTYLRYALKHSMWFAPFIRIWPILKQVFLYITQSVTTLRIFPKSNQHAFVLALAWFLIPFTTSWLISWFVPVIGPKRLLFAMPGFYLFILIASSMITQVIARLSLPIKVAQYFFNKVIIFGIILVINIATISMYWTNPLYQRENWRDLHAEISASFNQADTVLIFGFTGPFSPWAWYEQVHSVSPYFDTISTGYLTLEANQQELPNRLKKVTEYQYVLVFDYLRDLTDPSDSITLQLNSLGLQETQVIDYPNIGFIRVFSTQTARLGAADRHLSTNTN